MAQIVNVLLVDDLDGGEATETVGFGLGSDVYEIDLNEQHATELRGALAAFVAAARPVKLTTSKTPVRGGQKGTRPAVYTRTSAVKAGRGAQLAEIRAWARQEGHQVKERGRVPEAIQQAYYAAHSASGTAPAPSAPVQPASPQGAAESVPAVPAATFTPVKPAAPERAAGNGGKPRQPKDA